MLRDNAQKDPQVKRIIERIVQLLHSASTDTRHQLIMKIFIQADCINFDNISSESSFNSCVASVLSLHYLYFPHTKKIDITI